MFTFIGFDHLLGHISFPPHPDPLPPGEREIKGTTLS